MAGLPVVLRRLAGGRAGVLAGVQCRQRGRRGLGLATRCGAAAATCVTTSVSSVTTVVRVLPATALLGLRAGSPRGSSPLSTSAAQGARQDDQKEEGDPFPSSAQSGPVAYAKPHQATAQQPAAIPAARKLDDLPSSSVDLFLGSVGLAQHAEQVKALGVHHRSDLSLLKERDLTSIGIPVVSARRILTLGTRIPMDVSSVLSPQATLGEAAEKGLARGMRPDGVVVVSSIVGGALLSFGGMMYVMVGGGSLPLKETLPGVHALMSAAVFPVGLSMIMFTGTDLMTSNMYYHSLPFFTHPHRNVHLSTMLKIWGLSFAGNLVGSVGVALVAVNCVFLGDPWTGFMAAVAVKKTSASLGAVFVKAVCANWLVNVAVYMALTSRTAGGKIMALWIPIMTFVTLGFEHCVANMFFIPAGMLSGADVSVSQMFLDNLFPVALGNAVGATFFVSFLPWYTDWYGNSSRVREKFARYIKPGSGAGDGRAGGEVGGEGEVGAGSPKP